MPPKSAQQQVDDDATVQSSQNQDYREVSKIILQHFDKRQFVSQEESGDARSFLESYWSTTARYGWSHEVAATFFSHVVSPAIYESLKLHAQSNELTYEQIQASFPVVANPGGQVRWNATYLAMQQGSDESTTDFYTRFIIAARNAHPTWDTKQLLDDVATFEQKLRPDILQHMRTGASNLSESYQWALAAEQRVMTIAKNSEKAIVSSVSTPAADHVSHSGQSLNVDDLAAALVNAIQLRGVGARTCYGCGKPGHLVANCPNAATGPGNTSYRSRGGRRNGQRPRHRNNTSSFLPSYSHYDNRLTYRILTVDGRAGAGAKVVWVDVAFGSRHKLHRAMIDSGAQVSIADHDFLRKFANAQPRIPDGPLPSLFSISGHRLHVTGVAHVAVSIQGRRFEHVAILGVRGLPSTLQLVLGVDFLQTADALPYVNGNRLVFADELAVTQAPSVVATISPSATAESTAIVIVDPELMRVLQTIDFGDIAKLDIDRWIRVCAKYPEIWARNPDDYGAARLQPLNFKMLDDSPFYARRRNYSPLTLNAMHKQLDVWLAAGKVHRCDDATSSSPCVVVPKQDSDDLRVCIDYSHTINPRIPLLSYILPTMSEVLNVHVGAKVFSNIDFKDAFLQVPLHEDVKRHTAFFVPGRGTFAFDYMPFGLNVAPIYLQQCLDHLFTNLTGVSGYADDWITSGPDTDDALENFDKFLAKCASAKLKLKPVKCHIGHSTINVLGRKLSAQGISLQEDDIIAIDQWPEPNDFRELAGFKGKLTWVANFIPGIRNIIAPLARKRMRGGFHMGPEQRHAVKAAKEALKKAMTLALPDPNQPFTLEVDASRTGFGAVLMQGDRPIHFASKQLSPTEAGLQVTLLELAATVWAVDKFDYLLRGSKFTIVTDHKALTWLRGVRSPYKKLAIWATVLSQYDFEVQYRQGADHAVADSLSRSFAMPVLDREAGRLTISAITGQPDSMPTRQEFIDAQQSDPYCRNLIHALQQGDKELLAQSFILDADGVLCKLKFWWDYPMMLPMVPSDSNATFRRRVLYAVHERAAHNLKASQTLLKTNFFWKGAAEDMDKFASKCYGCQARKSGTGPRQVPEGTATATIPNELVACDVMSGLMQSPSGHDSILVMQDFASGYRVAVPLKSKTSAEVAKAAEVAWFNPYPGTRTVLTDRGGEFLGAEFEAILRQYGIKHMVSSDHHPHGNGRLENANRWIADSLSATLAELKLKGSQWTSALSNTMLGLNCAPSASTGQVPFYVFHGRPPPALHPLRPIQLTPQQQQQAQTLHTKTKAQIVHTQNQRILQAQDNNSKLSRVWNFKIGDLVMVYRPVLRKDAFSKLALPWIGPCEIYQIKDDQHVKVRLLPSGFSQQCSHYDASTHVSRIKPWKGTNNPSSPQAALQPREIRYKPISRDSNGLPLPPHAQVNQKNKPTADLQIKPTTVSQRPRPVTRTVSKMLLRGPP